jgi:alpha-L-rhamnosidase
MFYHAIPVYPQGKEREMNTFAAFRLETGNLAGTALHITACTFYQLWINGSFVAAGPARTAGGYAREDVICLDPFSGEHNHLIITVTGHYCRSLSTVKQPSFLQAELRRGEEALYWTGRDFEGFLSRRKVQKVQRYSGQRHFSEVWDLHEPLLTQPIPLVTVTPAPQIIPRVAPYPVYRAVCPNQIASRGEAIYDEALPYKAHKYSFEPSEFWGFYPDEDVCHFPMTWIQRHRFSMTGGRCDLPVTLGTNQYAIVDFGRIEAGFLTLRCQALEESQLILSYSECGTGEDHRLSFMSAHNVIEYLLPPDQAEEMSFEPYTARYVLVGVRSGQVRLDGVGMLTYEADTANARLPQTDDPQLAAVCRGALRTYAHNAVDLYTDCPSRERAGWLCDSYFTGKTEHYLFGRVPVEEAFLENYRLYQNDGSLPQGALPMCYPSDIRESEHVFIPQWTMWYILEVEEFLRERSADTDPALFRPSVQGLLDFYRRHENADGLLEKLPCWNFVEWSRANNWTQDVNYPTNFLYAQALDAAAQILGNTTLHQKADRVRRTAAEQSFNGTVFLDHAVRDEMGQLVLQPDCSEICQYYAILFGGIDIHAPEYSELYRLVTRVFGAVRKQPLADIEEINAFIGVYLRLEALLKMGEFHLVLQDIRDFFGAMEQKTGTLWEHRHDRGSRDHGFASYALVALDKALRGVSS